MTAGCLFSGIGGLDRGLEEAGIHVVWQVENDPHAVAILARHWPNVPNLGDVTLIDWTEVPRVDLLAGGFPCQDISDAHTNGTREALDGPRSGLWWHFHAAVAALRPRWVLVENVAAWRRWVPSVRESLHELGYASVPVQVSAGSLGAPHPRPRVFVVAHADGESEPLRTIHEEVAGLSPLPRGGGRDWREPFPRAVRVDDGATDRMDRLRRLGNAVVPAVGAYMGHLIVMSDASYTVGDS